MNYVIYFLLTLFATSVGSLTGMGGGVIIKPIMDVMGDYDVQSIGLIASITVFSMAIVSILKQIKAKTKIPFKTALPLAVGSVVGGIVGERVLKLIINLLNANSIVTVVQNVVLAVLILLVFIYMKNKNKIYRLLLAIGLVGQYIGKIYIEVKQRPRYNIEKVLDNEDE